MSSASADTDVVLRLRAATHEDWPRIRRWLGQPDIIRWWGPKATTEAEVLLALGSQQALCRIIEVGEVGVSGRWHPVGYAHGIDMALMQDTSSVGVPAGTWEVDLFVASAEHRGRGIGAKALGLLVGEVLATTLAVAVCAQVSVSNEKAVRAYESLGFRWARIVTAQGREPEWLMIAERTSILAASPKSSLAHSQQLRLL